MESEVRDAGRIVVWVEATPEVMMASSKRNANGPSTTSPTAPNSAVSSSYSVTASGPTTAIMATATPT